MLKIERKLDKAVSKIFKTRKCYYCHCKPSEPHHLVRRGNKLYRWSVENCIPVCRCCHRKIHDGILPEPPVPFEQRGLREYLTKNFICYRQFLELKAKEYGIKWTEKDFEKIKTCRKSRQVSKPVTKKSQWNWLTNNKDIQNRLDEYADKTKEHRQKQWKEAYQKKKLYNKSKKV